MFGASADDVSPCAHSHVTVEDLPWHWANAGADKTFGIADLPPEPHKVPIELATPSHRALTGQAVAFTVPAPPPARTATTRREDT